MAIYKRGRGVELKSTVKQFQLVVRAGLEPAISGFQVWRPNHSATLPPSPSLIHSFNRSVIHSFIHLKQMCKIYIHVLSLVFVRLLACIFFSFIHPLILPSLPSFLPSFTDSLIYSFILLFAFFRIS